MCTFNVNSIKNINGPKFANKNMLFLHKKLEGQTRHLKLLLTALFILLGGFSSKISILKSNNAKYMPTLKALCYPSRRSTNKII